MPALLPGPGRRLLLAAALALLLGGAAVRAKELGARKAGQRHKGKFVGELLDALEEGLGDLLGGDDDGGPKEPECLPAGGVPYSGHGSCGEATEGPSLLQLSLRDASAAEGLLQRRRRARGRAKDAPPAGVCTCDSGGRGVRSAPAVAV